jgi:hypothetical protein
MKPTPIPARADDAVTLDLHGEALVYQLRTGELHHLDQIGALVWQILDEHTTVDELTSDLAAAFDADESVIRRDVEGLLDRLSQAFLLASVPPPPPSPQPRQLTNPPSP